MTDGPHSPWWKKKRWAAAAVPLLVVAYPASAGPAAYLDGAGVTSGQLIPLYDPMDRLASWEAAEWWPAYTDWCYSLGRRHAQAD